MAFKDILFLTLMQLEEIYDSIDNVKGHIYKITNKVNNKIYIGKHALI
jgi:hypothetical protein